MMGKIWKAQIKEKIYDSLLSREPIPEEQEEFTEKHE